MQESAAERPKTTSASASARLTSGTTRSITARKIGSEGGVTPNCTPPRRARSISSRRLRSGRSREAAHVIAVGARGVDLDETIPVEAAQERGVRVVDRAREVAARRVAARAREQALHVGLDLALRRLLGRGAARGRLSPPWPRRRARDRGAGSSPARGSPPEEDHEQADEEHSTRRRSSPRDRRASRARGGGARPRSGRDRPACRWRDGCRTRRDRRGSPRRDTTDRESSTGGSLHAAGSCGHTSLDPAMIGHHACSSGVSG